MDFKEVILKDGDQCLSPVTIASSIYNEDGTRYMESVDTLIEGIQGQLTAAETEFPDSIELFKESANAEVNKILDGTILDDGTTTIAASELRSHYTINGQVFDGKHDIVTNSYVSRSVDNYYTVVDPPAKGATTVLNIGFKGQSSIYMNPSPNVNTLVIKKSASESDARFLFYPATSSDKYWALATSTSTDTDTTYYMLLIGC